MQIKDETVIRLLYNEASGANGLLCQAFPYIAAHIMDKTGFLLHKGPGLLTVAL